MDDHLDFAATTGAVFPGATTPGEFVRSTTTLLSKHGFAPANAIAGVAVCRDEIAAPIVADIEATWGRSFSLAGLAGLTTAGQTGFAAAANHSPVVDGRRRLVTCGFAHIGIARDGTMGEVSRPGVPHPSSACGALVAFHGELIDGTASPEFDPLNVEQSLLRQRLLPLIDEMNVPPLLDLTRLAADAIEEDLLAAITGLVDAEPEPLDAALITGIQIHGPGGIELVWPRAGHIVTATGVETLAL
ncbi:MAG: hypothetical protein ABFR89_10400 [Actinomycetota bacterium]